MLNEEFENNQTLLENFKPEIRNKCLIKGKDNTYTDKQEREK